MIQITDLILPFDYIDADLREKIVAELGIQAADLKSWKIVRSSLDARKKGSIRRVFTVQAEVKAEEKLLKIHKKNQKLSKAYPKEYQSQTVTTSQPEHRPIIVGTGPAGLFAGLILAESGLSPLLIERGKQVRERTQDTYNFWKNSDLNPESNVQFGEGGAGTYSDGKLQTRVKDKLNRDKKILYELVLAGAPAEILYENKPHIGTAKLVKVVENIRKKILRLGGEFKFQSLAVDLVITGNQIRGVRLKNGEEILSTTVILAVGHSARDTFLMLENHGIKLEAKPFSVGFRIEHPQSLINDNQYGKFAYHPRLKAADYQVANHTSSGRTVYSFCMCPGGTVVAAASEPGTIVTNGMSQYARDEENANSAIVAEIYPADFDYQPLGGIKFQRFWEEKAFLLGGGNFHAPCQLVGDFMKRQPSSTLGSVIPSYRPGVILTDLNQSLPEFIISAIREALPDFDRRIHGFLMDDAVLTGIETRTSSPVRIIRGADYQSVSHSGLYPAGEGSGYAGGILSSAMDGIKIAEAVIENIKTNE